MSMIDLITFLLLADTNLTRTDLIWAALSLISFHWTLRHGMLQVAHHQHPAPTLALLWQ